MMAAILCCAHQWQMATEYRPRATSATSWRGCARAKLNPVEAHQRRRGRTKIEAREKASSEHAKYKGTCVSMRRLGYAKASKPRSKAQLRPSENSSIASRAGSMRPALEIAAWRESCRRVSVCRNRQQSMARCRRKSLSRRLEL